MSKISYDDANAGKADFEWTYNRLDPRAYFDVLGELDYAIPERAAPVFLRVFDAYAGLRRRDTLTAIDLGCSYGINAAVLKYGLKMSDLRDHYLSFDDGATPRDILEADQKEFSAQKARQGLRIIGLDRAQCASSYGYWAGTLDDAIPENLEENDASEHAAKALSHCDLIISTGVVGYITERTFERIIACRAPDAQPWIASFVLRMFDYGPIAAKLADQGYVTEKLKGRTFKQRRFANAGEQSHVEQLLRERGMDPNGLESEGHYLAEFYLSRPKADADAQPLGSILPR